MAELDFDKERWMKLSDAFRHLKLTPEQSGIYCFTELEKTTGKSRALYVGKSKNLSQRLKLYHKFERIYFSEYNSLDKVLILRIFLTEDLDEKEIRYISRLKPLYNVAHNPNIQRRIIYQNGQTFYGHQ